MGKVIENNKLISGATILGDGEVALILDVNALF
jgi:two-component system chemotaxis sensor kinase CheA